MSSVSSTVVGRGGVAATDAETEDVTRDTYGFQAPPLVPTDPGQRIANAEREAAQAGIPGVELPESPEEVKERVQHREPVPKKERR